MERNLCCIVALLAATALAQPAEKRPKITGIDHVAFYSTSPEANQYLYTTLLGLATGAPIEAGQTERFFLGAATAARQWVGYSPALDARVTDRMDHIAFRTDDCGALRSYLAANGVKVPDSISILKDGSRAFKVKDPEGHEIEFVEIRNPVMTVTGSIVMTDVVSRHMIHAGFIVRDRDAEDHFYRDVLGFHIYWHGGMQPDRTDWVAMQVPDGTDWLEYMLNVDAKPSLRVTGVMNHISLGVADMKQAQAKLEAHGWTPHDNEHPQMGKDGKWQLNLFDPDLTRIELMEFKPSQKPCCSDFQGPHPQEP